MNVKAEHIPGKEMMMTHALSRSPQEIKAEKNELKYKVVKYTGEVVSASVWPLSDAKLKQIQKKPQKDVCLSATMDYTCKGWPEYKEDVKLAALPMYPYRELSIVNGILTTGDRMIISLSMKKKSVEESMRVILKYPNGENMGTKVFGGPASIKG